jgi:hypothetical protein
MTPCPLLFNPLCSGWLLLYTDQITILVPVIYHFKTYQNMSTTTTTTTTTTTDADVSTTGLSEIHTLILNPIKVFALLLCVIPKISNTTDQGTQ